MENQEQKIIAKALYQEQTVNFPLLYSPDGKELTEKRALRRHKFWVGTTREPDGVAKVFIFMIHPSGKHGAVYAVAEYHKLESIPDFVKERPVFDVIEKFLDK